MPRDPSTSNSAACSRNAVARRLARSADSWCRVTVLRPPTPLRIAGSHCCRSPRGLRRMHCSSRASTTARSRCARGRCLIRPCRPARTASVPSSLRFPAVTMRCSQIPRLARRSINSLTSGATSRTHCVFRPFRGQPVVKQLNRPSYRGGRLV